MMFRERVNADIAKDEFLKAFDSIKEFEILKIEECDGRVIAEDIVADKDIPNYHRAAMDGFAVRACDTFGASFESPLIFKLGDKIEKNTCVKVHTGSVLPQGADAVVMLEDSVMHEHENIVEIFTQVHPFKHVGVKGEDIKKGEKILTKGKRLRPCDIGVLASLGIKKIKVFKKPRVCIIPTGSELVSREKEELKQGEVYETNGLITKLYINKWGGIARLLDIIEDNPEKIKRAIASNLDTDMIIISGGTSVGERDYSAKIVKSMGKLLFHGIAISPGKPTALGIINNKPVVCIPGYPVAGIVALYFFVKPAIFKLANFNEYTKKVYAVLDEKVASKIGYKTFVRVKLENGKAIPLATSGAGILSSVSKADGFVIIPENIEGYPKNKRVEVELID